MSHSPTVEQQALRDSYETGWVAIHRMLREGKSWSGREQHCAFLNTRDGRFANVSGVSGLDVADDARAVALVDWDLDGRQDLWITGRNSPRARLFLNRSRVEHRSVTLKLVATSGAVDAIGARVEVHVAGEPVRMATVRAGEGYLAQSSRWLLVGVGAAERIERVVVKWPAGERVEEFTGVAPGGRYVLRQGAGAALEAKAERTPIATAPFEALEPTERARIVLTARPPLPPAAIEIPDGPLSDLVQGTPRPLLVNVWASWCSPCLAEMREFSERRAELAASGIHVLALSADEPSQRGAAIEALRNLRWEHLAAFATPEALDSLDALQRTVLDRRRRLPLPTSFLVDEKGDVAAIYKGPVSVETLLADVAKLRADAPARREAAAPFPGRWIADPPTAAPLEALLEAYFERGLAKAVDDVSRRSMELRKTSPSSVLNEMGLVLAKQGRLEEAVARFAEAARLDPEHLEAGFNYGLALHELLRIPEAIEQYKRVLRVDPRHAGALYSLGLARCALGDLETARGDLAALELLDPAQADKLRRQMETTFKR